MKCIILFGSIHQVMRAEKAFKEQGIDIDLIPVPREISSECGAAIELSFEEMNRALHLLERNEIPISECYIRDRKGFMKGAKSCSMAG